MKILAIETSCDDTGVALLDIKKSQIKTPVYRGGIKILADFASSQTAVHAPFGGVVPNLAVRAHYKNLPILLEKALTKINLSKIDLIAVTIGPGLEPCLWAGVRTARVLAQSMKKPIIGVNHLEGHIAANFIGGNPKFQIPNPKQIQNLKSMFPAICLIVSGGHTQLVLMKDIRRYEIIGQTRDDAAGEAFDKVAKLLNLGYPGGPQIALNAKKGDSRAFDLPRPMIDSDNYDFSFSGLKTAVLYLLKSMDFFPAQRQLLADCRFATPPAPQIGKQLPSHLQSKKGYRIHNTRLPKSGTGGQAKYLIQNLCASFQQAAIDVLIEKTIRATKEYEAKTVMLAGGVAANQELRKQMQNAVKKNLPSAICRLPSAEYCTDNAAMIGLAGYWKYARQGRGDKIEKIIAEANLNF